MKFSFKIQQYQTDAVDAVARVFQGQPYNAGVSYLRDMGNLSAQPQQLSLVSNGDDATQVELQDLINDSAFGFFGDGSSGLDRKQLSASIYGKSPTGSYDAWPVGLSFCIFVRQESGCLGTLHAVYYSA